MNVIELINQKYDISDTHDARIDTPFLYDSRHRITAVIGGSGTGKTTLVKKWFDIETTHFDFEDTLSVFENVFNNIDDFEETCKLMFDVGLSSVPVWKNKYSQLSNGEKLRFEIAYKLSSPSKIIFIDEFTSMLDRQVAKNLTLNIRKLVEKYDKKLVISTAHFDVLDWMKVDRLVDTTAKKSHTPQANQHLTHTDWKYVVYQEICGEYLSTITISPRQ